MKWNKPKKTSIVILLVIAFGALLTYNYVYKSHRDISSEAPVFTLGVNDLYHQFINDQSASNLKYANKTIVTYGVISTLDSENKTLVLNEQLSLSGEQIDFSNLEKGQSYKFKGRFIGFDDLLSELKMDQCELVK
jgi:predicted negative regulator of RcsB-dependent stress response